MKPILIYIILATFLVVGSINSIMAQTPEQLYQKGLGKEEGEGALQDAINFYNQIADNSNADKSLQAKALLHIGLCYEKLGMKEATKAYQRLVNTCPDQTEMVTLAKTRLAALSGSVGKGIVARQVGAQLDDRGYGPTISRLGRYIAFNYKNSIYIQDLVTGEERLVVARATPEERLYRPVISPDGKQVAYSKYAAGGSVEIYVVGSNGSNPRLLVGGKDPSAQPWCWSPDGKHVLAGFKRQDGKIEAALVSLTDGSCRVIASQVNWGRFSPDGHYIAFVKAPAHVSGQSDPENIFIVAVAGGREIQIVNGGWPLWAPDGKRLLFVRNRTGSKDLWSIPLLNGEPGGNPELVKGGMIGNLLDVTSDGDLYYQTGSYANDLYSAEFNSKTAKLTSRPRQILLSNIFGGATWSPDGESLAYYSFRGSQGAEKLTTVIRSMKTGDERELSMKGALKPSYSKPQWFPDSRSLFVYDQEGKLFQLDTQTGDSLPLLGSVSITYSDGAVNTMYRIPFVLAPNGHTIYYLSRDEAAHQTRILRRDLEGGPEKELCRMNAHMVEGLSVTPDGSRLVYVVTSLAPKKDFVIMTLATSDGEPKEVYRTSQWIHSTVWSKDGRRLFFIVQIPPGGRSSDIYSISAEGGEPQPLGIGLHDLYFLGMHPDGKQITFADEQYNNQLWVLENFLQKEETHNQQK